VVAVDCPTGRGQLTDQADAIVAAAAGADRIVLVAQSMGGFSAPLAATVFRSTGWCWSTP
jgi:hypothetical protein